MFLAAVNRARRTSFDAFANSTRQWREELLGYFEQPTTNGYAKASSRRSK